VQGRIKFLALAAGVIVSIALSGPARASYITTVTLTDNTSFSVDGVTTTWAGAGAISDLQLFAPPAGGAPTLTGSDTINLTFANPLAVGGIIAFSFVSETAPVSFVSGTWAISPGGRNGTIDVNQIADNVQFSTAALVVVPEPQSLSLIVLGLSGVLGLRRWTKQAKAARAA